MRATVRSIIILAGAGLAAAVASGFAGEARGQTVQYGAIVLSGQRAAGLPTGVNYASFTTPVRNASGQVEFSAKLAGTGVNTLNDTAIFSGSVTAPQLIAREGDHATGTAAGVNYGDFTFGVALNDAGQVYQTNALTGSGVTTANDLALYVGTAAGMQLIAREGDHAPGLPAGVTYQSFTIPPSLTNAGQLVYFGILTGTGVTTANDSALYVYEPVRGPILIARSGDLFDVGGGDFRTISGRPWRPGLQLRHHPRRRRPPGVPPALHR